MHRRTFFLICQFRHKQVFLRQIKQIFVKETKNYFLILLMIAAFAVFNPSPEIPEGKVAGQIVSGTEKFADFPVVPDTRVISIPVNAKPAKAPGVSAKAVLIKDIESGVAVYEKNSAEKLPIASLTKLMTALIVVENASLDDEVEIKASDLQTAPYRINFAVGDRVAIKDLLTAMLVPSANDAALALARHTFGSKEDFVKAMNNKARGLGMVSTSFANPVGFDSASHYSTAADMSLLAEEFIKHTELLDIVKLKSADIASLSSSRKQRVYTTNKLLLERDDVVGLKTGYTVEAKGSLITLVDNGNPESPLRYYSIMLGSDDREMETRMLMKWIEDNFIWR